MNNRKTSLRGVLMLLLTAMIWGSAFVAQSIGMESIGAFTFNGIRTLLGAAFLLPFILIHNHRTTRSMDAEQLAAWKQRNRRTWIVGAILGVIFCVAGNVQQFAFHYSTPGKIAFISSFYMFFVPLFGLVLRKRVSWITWLCVLGGCAGLYFLCVDPAELGVFNKGDVLSLIAAMVFAVHILFIERFAQRLDGVKISFVQLVVSGTISCTLMFLTESPQIGSILTAALPLMYAGFLSCGIAYTFQIVGQKYTEATIASLLMCLESVFGALSSALVLHERLSGREILGCAIMFVSIIISQVFGVRCEPKKKDEAAGEERK